MVHIFNDSKELADIIITMDLHGNNFCTLHSTTVPYHNKYDPQGNFFEDMFPGEVFCIKREYISLGIRYSNAVNIRRLRENKSPNFKSNPLPWGKWYGNAVITHEKKLYLRYTLNMNYNASYNERLFVYKNGTLLSNEEIKQYKKFLPIKEKNTRQELSNPVNVRNVKLEGVTHIITKGDSYIRKGFS